ncbi:MAG: selenium-dependent molybdenum cofactor biosynthesis protein YqeB [Clostridia bacterium]|nr:selenium-dependent molybdenum cofactor biosynthesis protein YqeB [Clostridia bacterium]
MLIVVKGAGDIASGIALRLHHAGFPVLMTDIERPLCVRRTVSFCEAVRLGCCTVEDTEAVRISVPEEASAVIAVGKIPVLVDEQAECIGILKPDAVIDAILAKRNLGTKITDAPVVIGVGPGFCAGKDCHAVIETKRGHTLGRVIRSGEPIPNTGVPGNIGGFTTERVLRAPANGVFRGVCKISDVVRKGETVAYVNDIPVPATIDGVLRGLLADGIEVTEGLKIGDIDPRAAVENCFTCSDKALSVAGGALEAVCGLLKERRFAE